MVAAAAVPVNVRPHFTIHVTLSGRHEMEDYDDNAEPSVMQLSKVLLIIAGDGGGALMASEL